MPGVALASTTPEIPVGVAVSPAGAVVMPEGPSHVMVAPVAPPLKAKLMGVMASP